MRRLDAPDGRPELLVMRALKLGDLLVAVPAIRGLRRAFPEHRLVLAVPEWLDEMVDLVPGVDALLPTPGLDRPLAIGADRVDIAVNMHGRGPESSDVLRAIRPARLFAHRVDVGDGPEWQDGIHERVRWARLVSAFGAPADPDEVDIADPGPTDRPGAAVVHVGAFYGSRRWPVDRFGAVARHLADRGLDVVFTGSAAERERALAVAAAAGLGEDAVAAGRVGLRGFAQLVAHARVVLSADTGGAHLASAYRRPSVVIFGPVPPEEWGPPPGPHTVLTDASVRRGDTFVDDPDPALLAVTVEQVITALEERLAEQPPR